MKPVSGKKILSKNRGRARFDLSNDLVYVLVPSICGPTKPLRGTTKMAHARSKMII